MFVVFLWGNMFCSRKLVHRCGDGVQSVVDCGMRIVGLLNVVLDCGT